MRRQSVGSAISTFVAGIVDHEMTTHLGGSGSGAKIYRFRIPDLEEDNQKEDKVARSMWNQTK